MGTLEAKHNTEDILAVHNQWATALLMIRANGVCFYKEFNRVDKWVYIHPQKTYLILLLIIIKHFYSLQWPFSSILQTQLLPATVHSSIQKLRLQAKNAEMFTKELKFHMLQKKCLSPFNTGSVFAALARHDSVWKHLLLCLY